MINFETHKTNILMFFKIVVVLMLISFVLLKPIHSFASIFSDNKIEFSSVDTDKNESDEKDSDKNESEENDDELEGKFSIHILNSKGYIFRNMMFFNDQNCVNEIHLGVISPPPELV